MANPNIPKDPVMLLSFINMKLRDFYPSLDELCTDLDLNVMMFPKNWHLPVLTTMEN